MNRQYVKGKILKAQALIPHNTIYSFHHVSSNPEIDLSNRKLDTDKFYWFVMTHHPYVTIAEALTGKMDGKKSLTFDDGLEDVYTIAYPYLKRNNIPFTIFVLTDKVDEPGYITKEQLLEMAQDPLVTIGSHGISHTKITLLTEDEQKREIFESKSWLEDAIGDEYKCGIFCYPSGKYTEYAMRCLVGAGYEYAVAVKGRHLYRQDMKRRYEIPRISVSNENAEYL